MMRYKFNVSAMYQALMKEYSHILRGTDANQFINRTGVKHLCFRRTRRQSSEKFRIYFLIYFDIYRSHHEGWDPDNLFGKTSRSSC